MFLRPKCEPTPKESWVQVSTAESRGWTVTSMMLQMYLSIYLKSMHVHGPFLKYFHGHIRVWERKKKNVITILLVWEFFWEKKEANVIIVISSWKKEMGFIELGRVTKDYNLENQEWIGRCSSLFSLHFFLLLGGSRSVGRNSHIPLHFPPLKITQTSYEVVLLVLLTFICFHSCNEL